MKKLLYVLLIGVGLSSCGLNDSSEDALVKKRIIQKVEVEGMGMLKDVKMESVEKLDELTYKGVHSFYNPLFDKEIRVTRIYLFSEDLQNITKKENVKIEMKSEGEWVKADFNFDE